MTTQPTKDPSVLNGHLKMIRKIALNLHRQYGHDFEDLFSEACLQYLLKCSGFKSDLGTKYTTYIWGQVQGALKNYIRKNSTPVMESIDILMEVSERPRPTPAPCKKHQLMNNFIYNAF